MKRSQQWKAQWNGHPIRVEHDDAWGKSETRLFVDGLCVHRVAGNFGNEPHICEDEFEDESGTHQVKTKFGMNRGLTCHIFVDGELIGGDRHKKISFNADEIESLPAEEQIKLLKCQLFTIWITMPASYLLGCYLVSLFVHSLPWFFMLFQLPVMIIPSAIKANRKLRELQKQDDSKNPTSV